MRKDMKTIVLDKSYLQGASKNEVNRLCDDYWVIMIDTLFMELISAEPVYRARCFNKLPEKPNPVSILPSVSNLLQFEIENNKPCTPIINMKYKESFSFNNGLGKQTFVISEEDRKNIDAWESEVCGGLNDYCDTSKLVVDFFPKLIGIGPGSVNGIIKETMDAISSDVDMIREIYGAIRKDAFPIKNILNKKWAFFRWVQVYLMAGVEYINKYGNIANHNPHKLMNEKLDMDYCIIGSLADGIATRDQSLTDRYKYICPNGIVIK